MKDDCALNGQLKNDGIFSGYHKNIVSFFSMGALGVIGFLCLLVGWLCFGSNNVYASYYTVGMSTSGSVDVNVASVTNGTGIGSDSLTVTSTCPYGYTVSISGPSDRNLYKGGDSSNNTSGTYITPSSGTTANPVSITGANRGTWGYSLTSSTVSGTFIGLSSSQTTLTSKNSASASGGDNIPVYYGVSIPDTIAPGQYKMTGTSSITYYLTTNENCFSYQVSFNANGGSGTAMANQRIYEGVATPLSANTYTAPSGKVFIGWNTAADGSGTSYTNQQSVTDIANPGTTLPLYAQWITPDYIQDMEFSDCTTTPKTVYDKRDLKAYTVAKLADGNCWMTSNLNLAGGTALSANDTDVDASYISSFTTSNNLTKSGGTIVLPASSQSGFSTNNYSYVYNSPSTDCSSSTGCYGYYSWDAATLGSGRSISTDNTDAPYSICPKGWKLPTSRTTSATNWQITSNFYALAHQYGLDSTTSTNESDNGFYTLAGPGTTPNFLLAGYYDEGSFSSGESYGYYWSATSRSSTSGARSLNFDPSTVDSATNDYRSFGTSVRCMKEDPALYKKVEKQSKGTQTASDLQATISASNSGVYQYNSSAFGAATDAASTHNIYYYRGILDNTTGTYGSNGDGKAYPNYVILDADGTKTTADTCWRIIRTTGSGGVKMIYNGKWTGSTCANATTAAMISSPVSTSTFNGTASTASIARQVVRVGYTHNSTYASTSTTTGTTYTTVMGSDSNYSVNNTNSTIKGNIETWYDSTLSDYTAILEPNANYCNDRQSYTTATGTTATSSIRPYTTSTNTGATYVAYFAGSQRNMQTTRTPSLGCPRSTVDRYSTDTSAGGNGQLSRPVALITADEASFAGSGSSTATQGSGYNANSYLRNGSTFWTMTPYYRSGSYVYNFYMNANGYMQNGRIDTAYGIRPVISLKDGVGISGGTGTATDPWVVTPMTMQDVTNLDLASMMPNIGDSVTLIDKRDGQKYKIGKLADGRYWMLDNLRLDPVNVNLSSSDTNAPSEALSIYKNGGTTSINGWTSSAVQEVSSGWNSMVSPQINTSSKDTVPTAYSSGSGKVGVFYNYCAASAGTYCYNDGSNTNLNASYDLCPTGWRLPTGSSNGELQLLYNAYSQNNSAFINAFSFVLSGNYFGSVSNQGARGYLWSSSFDTSASEGAMASLYYRSDNDSLSPTSYGSRNYGYPIRCIYNGAQ